MLRIAAAEISPCGIEAQPRTSTSLIFLLGTIAAPILLDNSTTTVGFGSVGVIGNGVCRPIAKVASTMSPSLAGYRIDPLMDAELRNWLGKDFGATVATFKTTGSNKLDDVVELNYGTNADRNDMIWISQIENIYTEREKGV